MIGPRASWPSRSVSSWRAIAAACRPAYAEGLAESIAAVDRLRVDGTEPDFPEADHLLLRLDRLGVTAGAPVGNAQIEVAEEGVGMLGAEQGHATLQGRLE